MAIQELSGDLGQYQGSFPGGLGIVAANFQGQIRWKKKKKATFTVSAPNLPSPRQFYTQSSPANFSAGFVAWSWKSMEKDAAGLREEK